MNDDAYIKLNNVTIQWPYLFEKNKYDKYHAMFILDKDKHKQEIELIKSRCEAMSEPYKALKKKAKITFIYNGDKPNEEQKEYPNSYVVRASSRYTQPVCVNENKEKITDPSHIQGGDTVNAYLNLYSFDNENQCGISIELIAVQFVQEGDRVLVQRDIDIDKLFETVVTTSGDNVDTNRDEIDIFG